MSRADRIRLCALNYIIEPAREAGLDEISICSGDLPAEMGLTDDFSTICEALGGEEFQKLAQVPPPKQTGPNPSSSTIFTYRLASKAEADPVTETLKSIAPAATNLIFYGPPGTGKTYHSTWEAVQLCLGTEAATPLKNDRDAQMAEYRRLVGEGRIEFVTFHQSMSYEEFVEGLRPVTNSEQGSESGAGFSLQPTPGIFQRISRRAEVAMGGVADERMLTDLQDARMTLDGRGVHQMSLGEAGTPGGAEIFEECIEKSIALFGFEDIDWSDPIFADKDQILKTCQDRGLRQKEYSNQSGSVQMLDHFRNKVSIGDILVVSKGNSRFRAIAEVVGEYEFQPRPAGTYSQRRAVRWLWIDREGVPVDEIHDRNFTQKTIYGLKRDRLNIAALERYMNYGHASGEDVPTQTEHFVLIIDEINRANISKVFGELITLLEHDKRLGAPNEIRVQLPYSKARFGVPSNLHIVGTMNTADRSIALLDTALRRRFTFQELMPDPTILSEDVGGINLQALLSTINERIEYLFDREHQIGHAYFTSCRSRTDVEDVMRHKVIPLLAKYFYEDWSKVAAVLGDGNGAAGTYFLEAKKLSPPAGFTDDELGGEKLHWSVKKEFDFSGFKV